MTTPTDRTPKRRADAERNREKILEAARGAFAEPGAEVSMAEVSRRAGVGMATLYRNFPGRRELLEALYVEEVDGVCAAAGTVEGDTPVARLEAWVLRFRRVQGVNGCGDAQVVRYRRVVHENVESAVAPLDLARRRTNAPLVVHVEGQELRPDALRPQRRRRLLAPAGVARPDQHCRAAQAELPRRLPPDALVRAGHQRNLAREIVCHV